MGRGSWVMSGPIKIQILLSMQDLWSLGSAYWSCIDRRIWIPIGRIYPNQGLLILWVASQLIFEDLRCNSVLARTACLFSLSSTSLPNKSYNCAPFIVMLVPSCRVCFNSASFEPISNVGNPELSPFVSFSFSANEEFIFTAVTWGGPYWICLLYTSDAADE